VAGLRVLVVSDWYPDDPNAAAGSFVRQQALAAARASDVTVLHLRRGVAGEGRPRIADDRDGPLRTLRVRGSPAKLPITAGNVVAVALALRRMRREGRAPQMVHAHEFSAGFAALVAGRLLGLPLIVSEHSSAFALGGLDRVSRGLARRTFAAADLVCPVSEAQRVVLERHGWHGRFEVVPNVVDTELFQPALTGDREGGRIVVVASLVPVKGIADLIEATGMLQALRSDFRVDLVGDGPLRADLERRAREIGLGSRLKFHGALGREAVARLVQGAGFAVVPSRFETFSVVLSEAMASGLPVVATAVGGMPERVHEGNGILCRAGDPPALRDAIAQMLDTQRDYDRAAIAAEVRSQLSPDVLGARWTELYRAVLGSRRRHAMS
jgi:glycosyltransferase involved in cell wall biosynthesis